MCTCGSCFHETQTHYLENRHIRSEQRQSRWTLARNTDSTGNTCIRQNTNYVWILNQSLYTVFYNVQYTVDLIPESSSLFFLRVIWVSWGSCWCRARSACGQNTRRATPRWKIWPDSSPCRGTSSSTRRPCSSARGGRRTERATRKLPHTASNSLWMWDVSYNASLLIY